MDSIPDIPGIRISIKTTSGMTSGILDNASDPVAYNPAHTNSPDFSRVRFVSRRSPESSSTTQNLIKCCGLLLRKHGLGPVPDRAGPDGETVFFPFEAVRRRKFMRRMLDGRTNKVVEGWNANRQAPQRLQLCHGDVRRIAQLIGARPVW